MKTLLLTFIAVATCYTAQSLAVDTLPSQTTQNPAPVVATTPAPVAQVQTDDVPQLVELYQKAAPSLDKVTQTYINLLNAKKALYYNKDNISKAGPDLVSLMSKSKDLEANSNVGALQKAGILAQFELFDAHIAKSQEVSAKVASVLNAQKEYINACLKSEKDIKPILAKAKNIQRTIDTGAASGKFTQAKKANASDMVVKIQAMYDQALLNSQNAKAIIQTIQSAPKTA